MPNLMKSHIIELIFQSARTTSRETGGEGGTRSPVKERVVDLRRGLLIEVVISRKEIEFIRRHK